MANATQAAFSSEVIANTESYTHSLTLTVWVAEDSFGNLLSEQNPEQISNPWKFSSKYSEVENGLTYFNYRYYSARDGRFVSEDPIEERGGMLLYGYCRNEPIGRIDKYGQWTITLTDTKKEKPNCCGGYYFERTWQLNPDEKKNEKLSYGVIVQEMEFHVELKYCEHLKKTNPKAIDMHWWEAFEYDTKRGGWVSVGPPQTPGRLPDGRASVVERLSAQKDRWTYGEQEICTSGTGWERGKATYYHEFSLKNPPWLPGDGKSPWGWAPHVNGADRPDGLPTTGSSEVVDEKLEFAWKCCRTRNPTELSGTGGFKK